MTEAEPTYLISDIERLVEPLATKTRAQARRAVIGFLLAGTFIVLMLFVATVVRPSQGATFQDHALKLTTFFVGIGVIPGLVVRSMILRDLDRIPQVLRHGTAFAGRLDARMVGATGIHHVRVSWDEAGRVCGAQFDDVEVPERASTVTVVAEPNNSNVAIVLDEKLYVGMRSARPLGSA